VQRRFSELLQLGAVSFEHRVQLRGLRVVQIQFSNEHLFAVPLGELGRFALKSVE
jgi:hypothetical protein